MASKAPTNTSGLSKSQKKRMKQKASKAKREAEQKKENGSSLNSAFSTNAANLTPHEKLCNDLIHKGYKLNEIENALEEMWNLDMQYDDFHAVLAYLEGKKAQEQADAEKEVAAQAAADRIESVSTDMAGSGPVTESGDLSNNVGKDEKWDEQQSEGTGSMPSAAAGPSSISASESQPQSMDLASKLDIVAKFENLYDAVFALAEWVNKAAKPNQLMSLCTTGQNSERPALNTIIVRVIQSSSDSEFDSVLSVFLSITSGIYIAATGKSNPSTNSTLSETLSYVRDAMKLTISNESDEIDSISVSNAMSETVSNQICQSIKMIIARGSSLDQPNVVQGDKTATIRKMESEIQTLLAEQPPSNGGGVMELMTRRDCRKAAAEKSSAIARLVLPTSKTSIIQNGGSSQSNLSTNGKTVLLSNLFGGHINSYQNSRTQYTNLESRLNTMNSSLVQERNQLSSELKVCQAEMSRIESRKEELKKELDLLNNEESRVSMRTDFLKERMESIYDSSSTPEIENMNVELKARAKLIEVEEKIFGIPEKLTLFEESLFFTQPLEVNTEGTDVDPIQIREKMESFLTLVKNYFITEADCVNFMQNRITRIQHDMKELQREIAECTGLGMATNVSKMTNSLDSFSRNIIEDERVISLLREDAQSIRDDVIERVDEYQNSGNQITTSHKTELGTIGALLVRLKIGSNDPIFTQTSDNRLVSEKTEMFQEHQGANTGSNGFHPVPAEPSTNNGNVEPPLKLSWASSSGSKSQVKSLVDIQREELSRKVN